MLSSLASFVFGGLIRNVQDENLQCETTEVNEDWLLVNAPSHPSDNFVNLDYLDSEDEALEDIHYILPLESSSDNSFNDVISPSLLYEQPPMDCSASTQTSFLVDECLENIQPFTKPQFLVRASFHPSEYPLIASHRFEQSHELSKFPLSFKTVSRKKTHWDVDERRNNRAKKAEVTDKRVCHPAAAAEDFLKATFPDKKTLQDQIEELKPMQQNFEYELRKQMSKSRLSRQNKTHVHESSAKPNGKSKKWSNHSGVNNNRKCNQC